MQLYVKWDPDTESIISVLKRAKAITGIPTLTAAT